jgi:hypothetical protein
MWNKIPCARKWWLISPTTAGRARPHIAVDLKIHGSISNRHRRQWLNNGSNGQADDFIRECTTMGPPCGDSAMVRQIEEKTNRDFTRKKAGPKPKVQQDQASLRWPEDPKLS